MMPKMKETELGCGKVKFVELTNDGQTTHDFFRVGWKHGGPKKLYNKHVWKMLEDEINFFFAAL